MKLVNYKQIKEKKMTSGMFFGSISLLCLCIAILYIVAMIISNSLLDDIAFLRFFTDNISKEVLARAISIFAFIFSLLSCACAYKAFVYADNKYFSKMKSGIIFKIILWILPVLLIPAVRCDIANFKNADKINQRLKENIYNNPQYFLEQESFEYNVIGYLVFDENKEPHAILKKLKEGRNKAKFSSDFLSMNISLDLAIEGDLFKISNLSISGKINHSDTNLMSMTKENLPPMDATQIISQATISSANQETGEPDIYKAYIFFYKRQNQAID